MLQLKSIKTLPEKQNKDILTKLGLYLEYFITDGKNNTTTLEHRPNQLMIQPVRMAEPNIKKIRGLGNYQRQVPDFAPAVGLY